MRTEDRFNEEEKPDAAYPDASKAAALVRAFKRFGSERKKPMFPKGPRNGVAKTDRHERAEVTSSP